MRGSGQFREQLIGGDYSLTILYSELKKEFETLFEELEDLKEACESVPVDEKYR
jgi:hypothetical protein